MKKRIAGILALLVLIGGLAQAGPTLSTASVKTTVTTASKLACGSGGC
jgi:hypothetical protein